MKHRDERPRVDSDDLAFSDRLAAHYAPPPWTPAARAGFDEALRARIERRPRRAWLVPALAGVAAALVVGIGLSLRPAREPAVPVVAGVWESELFLSSDVSPLDDDDTEGLPDDYQAIASLFLDG